MSDSLIFSVDAGKGFTKYARALPDGSIDKNKFMTKYTELNELDNIGLVGEDSYLIKYKDKQYILGVQGKYDLREQRTKKNEIHRLCALVAITQMLKEQTSDGNVNLVISMPSASYKNEIERKAYEEFYKGEGEVEIEVNNTKYNFKINNVLSLPESSGFMFKYSELCRGKVAIIDIGHLNINFILLQDNNIVDMITLDEGGLELESSALDKLETSYEKKIGRDVLIKTLKQGYYEAWGTKVESSVKLIKEVKEDYVSNIIKKASSREINLEEFDKIYFIGGTSLLLRDVIESNEQLSKTCEVKDDGQWITTEGNLVFATAYFSNIEEESDVNAKA